MPRMNKTQRAAAAVEIAKDALKWLNSGKIEASNGVYCNLTSMAIYDEDADDFSAEGESIQKVIQTKLKKSRPCEVCAKGAMFIAAVDLHNKVNIPRYDEGFVDSHDFVVAPLLKYFDQRTLDAIEFAFEGRPVKGYFNVYGDDSALGAFNIKYDYDPKSILRAILKNVIKNNGKFVVAGVTY